MTLTIGITVAIVVRAKPNYPLPQGWRQAGPIGRNSRYHPNDDGAAFVGLLQRDAGSPAGRDPGGIGAFINRGAAPVIPERFSRNDAAHRPRAKVLLAAAGGQSFFHCLLQGHLAGEGLAKVKRCLEQPGQQHIFAVPGDPEPLFHFGKTGFADACRHYNIPLHREHSLADIIKLKGARIASTDAIVRSNAGAGTGKQAKQGDWRLAGNSLAWLRLRFSGA